MNENLTTDRATFVTHLECSITGERYEADQLHGLSRAGRPLLVRYDLDAVRAAISRDTIEARPTDLWRWRELLPVRQTSNIVSLGEIETPLVPLTKSGGPNVLVKDEGRLPTGSFKDRGASVMLSLLRAEGVRAVLEDSSGNGGAAIAAYAAAGGMRAKIMVPDSTSPAKTVQSRASGAEIGPQDGGPDRDITGRDAD